MSTRRAAVASLACVLVAALACRAPEANTNAATTGHQHHHRPEGRDLEGYIAAMESAERATWQKPDEVIAALQLKPNERVADVGAGPGYFTLRIAKAVDPEQRVWAVDVEPKMLDRLRVRADEQGVANIAYVVAEPDSPSLPPHQFDTLLIVNTYHHFPDRAAYLRKLRDALAPGGRIVNIDFIPKSREERGFGPPEWMQLPRSAVDAEMAAAGMRPTAAHDFLPEQYFVEYRVADE